MRGRDVKKTGPAAQIEAQLPFQSPYSSHSGVRVPSMVMSPEHLRTLKCVVSPSIGRDPQSEMKFNQKKTGLDNKTHIPKSPNSQRISKAKQRLQMIELAKLAMQINLYIDNYKHTT